MFLIVFGLPGYISCVHSKCVKTSCINIYIYIHMYIYSILDVCVYDMYVYTWCIYIYSCVCVCDIYTNIRIYTTHIMLYNLCVYTGMIK